MDDFKFNIKRNTETTWTFYFENESEKTIIWASDFMDPIGSLFYDLRMFLKNGYTEGVVSMIDEPEENIWNLNLAKGMIEVEIYNFKDYCGNTRDVTKGEKIFSGKMKFTRFLNQLVNLLTPFEKENGISELLNEFIELRRKTKSTKN